MLSKSSYGIASCVLNKEQINEHRCSSNNVTEIHVYVIPAKDSLEIFHTAVPWNFQSSLGKSHFRSCQFAYK